MKKIFLLTLMGLLVSSLAYGAGATKWETSSNDAKSVVLYGTADAGDSIVRVKTDAAGAIQAVVTGSATLSNLKLINSGAGVDNVVRQDLYSTGAESANYYTTRRSLGTTEGTLTETTDGVYIGVSTWEGTNSSSAFHQGANYTIIQNGAAGATHVPVNWSFSTSSAVARNTDQFVLCSDNTLWGTAWNDQRAYQSAGDMLSVGDLTDILLLAWITPATTEQDLSPNNNDATYHGSMTTADQIHKGMLWSLDFDGTDDYLSISDSADFTFNDAGGANGFTIYCWAQLVPSGLAKTILSKHDETTGSELREWLFRFDASEKLQLILVDESANVAPYRLTDGAITSGWRFVAVVYDGSGGATAADGITIYVDGIVEASSATNDVSYVGMEDTATDPLVGASTGSAGTASNYFNGDMGVIGMTPDQLTAAEIWEMYLKTRGSYNE